MSKEKKEDVLTCLN